MRLGSKKVFTIAAIFNMLMALLTSFLPDETLVFLNLSSAKEYALFVQIIGAFFLGLAMLNYMGRSVPTGGIYNRPMLFANLAYHGTSAVVLIKYWVSTPLTFGVLHILTIVYIVLGASFLVLLRNDPTSQKTSDV